MRNQLSRLRAAMGLGLTAPLLGVSCAQAVAREAQFGALDGVNVFVTDVVAAFLTAVVPFVQPA